MISLAINDTVVGKNVYKILNNKKNIHNFVKKTCWRHTISVAFKNSGNKNPL